MGEGATEELAAFPGPHLFDYTKEIRRLSCSRNRRRTGNEATEEWALEAEPRTPVT